MKPPETLLPCLGVMCERHGRCARYAAIDGSHIPSERFMALCSDGLGGRPEFVPNTPADD